MYPQWCLLLSLVTIAAGIECPEGPDCSACSKSAPNEFEISCSSFNWDGGWMVHFKPSDWIQISCDGWQDWSAFKLGTLRQIFGIKTITFRDCDIPEPEILGAITHQLLGDDVKDLRIYNSEYLNEFLTKDTLSGFKDVETLYLAASGLKNVTPDLLSDLKNLQLLYLRDNELKDFPPDFLNLPHLTAVELSGNNLQVIEPTTFEKPTNLRYLNLWKNKIADIKPDSFDKVQHLKTLELRNNRLKSLPKDIFAKLRKLKFIGLAQNNFSGDALHSNLLQGLESLEQVRFFENRQNLTTLPARFFADLRKLAEVELHSNGLLRLPEDLFSGAVNLRLLTLHHNYLEEIPKRFFEDCQNLRSLYLRANQLRELPDRLFSNLQTLEILDLSDNFIQEITEFTFEGLISLTDLSLEHNGLKTIHYDALVTLDHLKTASLAFNHLTFLGPTELSPSKILRNSPFAHCLHSIQQIDLAYNNISVIFDDWLVAHLLEKLNLSHNQLRELQSDDLTFLSNINIDVSSNHIETVRLTSPDNISLTEYKTLKIALSIDDNPLTCDCKLYDLLLYRDNRTYPGFRDQFSVNMEDLVCHKPDHLAGTPLNKLKATSLTCEVSDSAALNFSCPEPCECHAHPHTRAILMDCANRSLLEAPPALRIPVNVDVELNLTANFISEMPSMTQPGYSSVTVLVLADNEISEVPPTALSRKLQDLDLSYNRLQRLESSVLTFLENSTSLKHLKLEGNPWSADCDARDFLIFIQTTQERIPDLRVVSFGGYAVPAFKMILEELCPPIAGWVIGFSVGLATLGMILGILAGLYYRYQQEIKVWLFAKRWCLWWVSEEDLDENKVYDAFISYSHKDEEFVMNELMRVLEGGVQPYKMCVHYRDWQAGEWIPTQIANSVEESRRTIVVLSPSFLESVWGKMEFRTAHQQALSEGRPRVVVILYGDIGAIEQLEPELKAYLSMNTYVKWGDPWFWDKLRYALPHRGASRQMARPSIFKREIPSLPTDSGKV